MPFKAIFMAINMCTDYDTQVTSVDVQSANKEHPQPFRRPQYYTLIRLSYKHRFTHRFAQSYLGSLIHCPQDALDA